MPFSKETLDFLYENKLHDSRSWFAEHKKEYQTLVIQPMKELVTALTPAVLALDEKFIVEPRVDRTISRIWRDTRYTHDPSLYRDRMWIAFHRPGEVKGGGYPGVYFELGQYGFSYGSGFYSTSTAFMQALRELVLSGGPGFLAAEKAYRKQKVFVMEGETYKRPHFPDQTPEKRDWLERRELSFNALSKDFSLLFSDKLADKLTADFKLLAPVHRFLMEAADRTIEGS